ncbi:MAG: D-alanine--D-alanine ligase family protein [Actinomycetota bacterium]
MPEGKIRVAIIFGGRSAEHEVSCESARHVAAAMDPTKYDVIPIGISREGRWMLPDASRKALEGGVLEIPDGSLVAEGETVNILADPQRRQIVPADRHSAVDDISVEVVFPVLHGPYGEDGTVQGLLELAGIPYVGSGVLGSALSMDKEKMKVMFHAAGLPSPRYVVIREHDWTRQRRRLIDDAPQLGFPCFTKPANLGSSVGITRCVDPESLEAGIAEAFLHDRKVLVEEAIIGRELECGVLGNDEPQASGVGEVVSVRDFYDYEAKYRDEDSKTIIPADIPDPVAEVVRNYSIRAFQSVDAAGLARVDFFYQQDGRGVLINEINTIPGFTTISMFPKLWMATGLSYPNLIDRLIQLAMQRHDAKR